MSDMPAPAEAAPEQNVQEGNESGSGGPGENYGGDVDAFNDLSGQRPGSEGMDAPDDSMDGMDEGQEGEGFFGEGSDGSDGSEESGDGIGEGLADGQDDSQGDAETSPADLDMGDSSSSNAGEDGTPEGEGAPEANLDSPSDNGDTDNSESPGGDDTGPGNSDQTTGESGDDPESKNDSSSQEQSNPSEKDKASKPEKNAQSRPGDNMLSRLARGEPTEKDLAQMEKQREKQKQKSAVPKGPWLPKGGGGAKHAQPKETRKGPSKLEKYQNEMKAKARKWDETQTWNQKLIQQAKAQHEEILEGVRKVSKG